MTHRLLIALSLLVAHPACVMAQDGSSPFMRGQAPNPAIPEKFHYMIDAPPRPFRNFGRGPDSMPMFTRESYVAPAHDSGSLDAWFANFSYQPVAKLDWPQFSAAMLRKKQPLILFITDNQTIQSKRLSNLTLQDPGVKKLLDPFAKAQIEFDSPSLKTAGIDIENVTAPQLVLFDTEGKIIQSLPSYRNLSGYKVLQQVMDNLKDAYTLLNMPLP